MGLFDLVASQDLELESDIIMQDDSVSVEAWEI
jgi:hypothetical protein